MPDDFAGSRELHPDKTVCVEDLPDRRRALTSSRFDNATIEIDGQQYYVGPESRPADDSDEGSDGLISSY